jgi:hypothetical protein
VNTPSTPDTNILVPQVAGACRQVGGTLTPNWHSAPHSSSIAMHSGELWGAVFPEIVRAQGRQEAKGGRSSLLVCRRESSIQHWAVSCRREGCDDAMLGSLCSTFDYTTRRAGVHAMVQAFAPVLRLTGMQRSREQDGAHPRAAGRHTSRVEFQVSSLDLLDAHRAGGLRRCYLAEPAHEHSHERGRHAHVPFSSKHLAVVGGGVTIFRWRRSPWVTLSELATCEPSQY